MGEGGVCGGGGDGGGTCGRCFGVDVPILSSGSALVLVGRFGSGAGKLELLHAAVASSRAKQQDRKPIAKSSCPSI